TLLYDRLTKHEMFLRKRCHPSHMFHRNRTSRKHGDLTHEFAPGFRRWPRFRGRNTQEDLQYDKRPDTMDRFFSQNRITHIICGDKSAARKMSYVGLTESRGTNEGSR